MEGIQLKQVTEENDFGVIMDHELKFHCLTTTAVKKANHILAIIKTSFAVLNIFTLPFLFEALVSPLLEYSNVVMGPHYQLDLYALEKV